MRQVLPHLLVPSRRGGVEGKYFNVSQTSAFQLLSISNAPEQYAVKKRAKLWLLDGGEVSGRKAAENIYILRCMFGLFSNPLHHLLRWYWINDCQLQ